MLAWRQLFVEGDVGDGGGWGGLGRDVEEEE